MESSQGPPIFFYKPMTLTAYYPFTGVEGTTPGVITAKTNPENQKEGTQSKIDFLWDSKTGFTASDPKVEFTFAHKMSKVTFTFISSEPAFNKDGVQVSEGVDVTDMVAYDIAELIVDGKFDTVEGVCAADGTISEDRGLKMELKKGDAVSEKEMPSLIIFPQSLPEGSLTLRIYTDELEGADLQQYKCPLSFSNGEIKAGCHYKYSIKVTKYGLIVGQMTIED